ncbi:MAG TPA: carbohydrate binding domain-containing protein [Candidatus Methylomirabilis sp.]|nr:carbohydrate binding domain-containing protein [Candidatus Methylomirabilis sp.]
MSKKKYKKINMDLRKYIGLICILLVGIYPGISSAGSVNIISGSGFESGTSPWVFYTNGAGSFLNNAPGAGTPHAGHITISKQGTNVQLYQNNLALEPNTAYRLDFKAYSNTGHDLSVSLLKHGSPFTNYGLSDKVVNLGTKWGTHSIQFKTAGFSGIVNDARLMFRLAAYDAAADKYYFDNVILTKVSSVPSSTKVPPTITTHPSSKTVSVGKTATFNVAASGTAPLSYQWQKNGVNIPGATGSTYTTPVTTSTKNGNKFRAVASNTYGKAASNEAILTVTSSSASASNKQLVLIDETYTHTTTLSRTPVLRAAKPQTRTTSGKAFSFFNYPSGVPYNFVSPVNYAQGTLYQRLQVITKPSAKTVQYQLCLFQDAIIASKHACSDSTEMKFTGPGTYYASQSMQSLYQYNNIRWGRSLLMEMLVVKDSKGTPVDDRFGHAGKWSGSPNLGQYYPMKVRYTAIIVPPGGGKPVWP